jgi:hypothetical protein
VFRLVPLKSAREAGEGRLVSLAPASARALAGEDVSGGQFLARRGDGDSRALDAGRPGSTAASTGDSRSSISKLMRGGGLSWMVVRTPSGMYSIYTSVEFPGGGVRAYGQCATPIFLVMTKELA